MKKWLALLMCIGGLSSCVWVSSDGQADSNEAVTVFLSGQEAGTLKPCGCSDGQLGGLERRAALLQQVPEDSRLVLSTGALVETDSEQDRIKFPVFLQAYHLLHYDLVNFTERDLEMARQTGSMEQVRESGVRLISGVSAAQDIPAVFTRTYRLKDREIRVNIISVSVDGPLEDAVSANGQDDVPVIRIFVLNREDRERLNALSERISSLDCIITPSLLEEPKLINDPDTARAPADEPKVISIGRRGRYLGKLDITWDPHTDKPKLLFSSLPVSEDLPNHPALVELYRSYQHIVSAANLLERFARVPLPDDSLSYTGSESCKQCHGYEYLKWSEKKHAHAFATLEQVGSHRDPECVICHVVGMEYESGYLSETQTPQFKNVGCEVCHGPGSEHIRTYGQAKTTDPQKACLDCHTPEHSSGYAGHEQEYLEKIRHWMEP